MAETSLVAKVTWAFGGLGELQKLKGLFHRNIVAYTEAGLLDNDEWTVFGLRQGPREGQRLVWIIMDRAAGSLASMVGERGGIASAVVNADEGRRLWVHLDGALRYLEEELVVHGDIKPDNVLAFPAKSGMDYRLADFGVAVDIDPSRTSATILGASPIYQSPRSKVTGRVSFADDRYSAALTVHVALSGHLPLGGPGVPELNPAIPKDLVEPLRRALSFGAAGAPSELFSANGDATEVDPTEVLETSAKAPEDRPPWLVTVGGLIALLLLVAGGILVWQGNRDGNEESAGTSTSELATNVPVTDGSTAGTHPTTVVTGEGPGTASQAEPGADIDGDVFFSRRSGSSVAVVDLSLSSKRQAPVAIDLVNPRTPSASHAGSRLAVGSGESGSGEIAVGVPGERAFRVWKLGAGAGNPTLSPDGTKVAYESTAGGSSDIALLDLATGKVRVLIDGSADETDPAWSPNGTSVAAVRSGSSDDTVLVVAVSSGDWRVVARGNGASSPAWSPNGELLAYVADSAGNREVFTVAAQSDGEPSIFRSTAASERSVTWCRGGIVTSAPRRGLWLLAENQAADRKLTDNPGDDHPRCAPG